MGEIVRHDFSSGGLTSQYRVWARTDGQAPSRLVIFFHGDTGSNYGPRDLHPQIAVAEDEFKPQYVAFGAQDRPTPDQAFEEASRSDFWNQTVFLAILTPVHNGKWLTWHTDLEPERRTTLADFAFAAVLEVMDNYDIDYSSIYAVGQSGGANFLTETWLPRHGVIWAGGALALCGGQPASAGLEFSPQSDYFLYLRSTTNELDFLRDPIVRSRDWYSAKIPSRVFFDNDGDGNHCIFTLSQPSIIREVITARALGKSR